VSGEEVPRAVRAIADRWGGTDEPVKEVEDGVWRFGGDGFVYAVFRPGKEYPCYEDSGRPIGNYTSRHWTVRCVNDSPDSFWHVTTDGVYDGYNDVEKLWDVGEAEKRLLEAVFALARSVPLADDGWTVADTDEARQIIRIRDEAFELGAKLYGWTD
jgi:hypothetical protein